MYSKMDLASINYNGCEIELFLNRTKLCTYAKLNCIKFNSALNDPKGVDMP